MRLRHQALEILQVQLAGLDVDHVPASLPVECLRAEEFPQGVHLVLERSARGRRSSIAPQLIDELVLRDGLVRME